MYRLHYPENYSQYRKMNSPGVFKMRPFIILIFIMFIPIHNIYFEIHIEQNHDSLLFFLD